eukprot:2103908-Pyramimonas_sp.AAC.1
MRTPQQQHKHNVKIVRPYLLACHSSHIPQTFDTRPLRLRSCPRKPLRQMKRGGRKEGTMGEGGGWSTREIERLTGR